MTKDIHYLFVPKAELFAAEAAVMLGCSSAKVYILLNSGELKGRKEGRAWKVPVDEVYRYAGRAHIGIREH